MTVPGSYIMGRTPADTGEPWICGPMTVTPSRPKASIACPILTSDNTPPNPQAIGTAITNLPKIALGMFPASSVGITNVEFTITDKYSQPNPGTPACYTFVPYPSAQQGMWKVIPETAPPGCQGLIDPP